MSLKTQRVLDPLHDIIKFDGGQFEEALWRVVQTRPFQRLRRIKQLGFSELTFPGATHTRFAHSIGVFHTARQLMSVIERHMKANHLQYGDNEARTAVAAALVHDVGHGMFSHAFEDVGKHLELGMMHHEDVSRRLIQNSEITEPLNRIGHGFAEGVATVIGRRGPVDLYDAVVSSQFDADRLDYMRRDRLMAGVQSGGIDFPWLIDNLEIGAIKTGVDDAVSQNIDTFVLGPKSVLAAEAYVLALFQLYPTIYFHKTTRAAEKVFSALMIRVITMIRDGSLAKTGLPRTHPLTKFARKPEELDSVLALDDTVFWGALGMMTDADDASIADLAKRIRDRKLPKCINILPKIEEAAKGLTTNDEVQAKWIKRIKTTIEDRLTEWSKTNSEGSPRILVDKDKRNPYSRDHEKGPLNRIYVKDDIGNISDIEEYSPMIAAMRPFEVFRAYSYSGDKEAQDAVQDIINDAVQEAGHG